KVDAVGAGHDEESRLTHRRSLRPNDLLPPVFVDELQRRRCATSEDLYMSRIGISAEAQCRSVLGRRDFYIRSALGVDEPEQNRLRIPLGAIRHLRVGRRWKYLDHRTNAPPIIDDLKRTTSEHRCDLRIRR